MDTSSVWQAVLPWLKEQKLEFALRLWERQEQIYPGSGQASVEA